MNKTHLARPRIVLLAVCLILAAGGYWYYADEAAQGRTQAARPPSPAGIPVEVATAEKQDVPVMIRGIGMVQAYNKVAVKTRVDGQIVKVSFTEGQDVKAGDQLFQIDPRPFRALLEQVEAAKQRDEAQLQAAQLDLERYEKLIGSGYQSRQSYDQQKATVSGLKSSIAADQAQIDTAQLNLAYADIRAPIDGRTGQRLVDLGNLVQASQGATLVTIAQIKPIFVTFTIPQYANHNLRKNQAKAPLTVLAYAADDTYKLAEGKLTLIDNEVDAATGTLRLKATFENTDQRLWPGEFVNVHLQAALRAGVVTVPERAVMQGASGTYVYVIRPDDTAARRAVEVEARQDGLAVIAKGLAAGETIAVDGQYRLFDGGHVRIEHPAAGPAPSGEHTAKRG